MSSTNETKTPTAAKEGGEQVQPEKKERKTPPYIQTPCTQEVFDLHQQRRKELGESWGQYILAALELRMRQLEKRAGWREAKQRQAQSKKADGGVGQPAEAKEG